MLAIRRVVGKDKDPHVKTLRSLSTRGWDTRRYDPPLKTRGGAPAKPAGLKPGATLKAFRMCQLAAGR